MAAGEHASDFFDTWGKKAPEGAKVKHVMHLRVAYKPNLADADQECFPELHFYLSSFCGRGLAVVPVHDTLQAGQAETRFDVELAFSARPNHANAGGEELPADGNLNVRCFARHLTDKLERPLNEAGDATIPLRKLFGARKVEDFLVIPVQGDARRTWELSKGKISVTLLDSSARLASATYFREKFDLQAVTEYVRRDRALFDRYPPAFASIKRITAFVFRSDKVVPGAVFQDFGTRAPGPKSAAYIRHCLQLGVRRYYGNLPPGQGGGPAAHAASYDLGEFFCDAGRRPGLAARLEALMWALGVYVNSCTYITDLADHRQRSKDSGGLLNRLFGLGEKARDAGPLKDVTADYDEKAVYRETRVELVESFRNPFPRNSGDCEDFTHAILALVYTLRKYDGDDLVLRAARELSQLYVFCSCLIGVKSAALQDMQKARVDMNNIHLGGHMAVLAVPRLTYLRAVERCDPDHPLVAHLRAQQKENPGYFSKGLPVVPIEGTGVLKPAAYQPPAGCLFTEVSEDVKRQQTPFPTVANVARGLFYYDPDGINFYQVPILLTSPEMHPYPEVVACKRSRFAHAGHAGTRGVLFKELMEIDSNPDICLVPTAKIEGAVERAAEYALADMYPVYKAFRDIPEPEQAQLAKRALKLHASGADVQVDYCHYYVPHHNDTPRMRSEILALAKRHGCEVATTTEFIHKSPNDKHVWNVVYTLYRPLAAQ